MTTSNRLLRVWAVTMLLALAAMTLLPMAASAAAGIYESYVIINRDSSGNIYHKALGGDYNGYNLGTFGCNRTMVLNGAQIKTYKNNYSDVTGGKIYYRVYLTSSSGGSFANISLAFGENYPNPGDQRWETNNAGVNILNNLGPGTYFLEVYFEASTNGVNTANPVTDNNGGANYKATFTVLARTASGTGNWASGSTWVGGAVPPANADVEICNGSTVTLNTDPTVRTLKIVSGGALQDDATANTLTIAGTAAANPNFTNNGTFNAGSGTVAFAGQNNINGRVWGGSATTFNNVTISYNGSGTGHTDVFGVDFYDQSTDKRSTINGVLTINTRGFVAHAEVGSTTNNPSPCPNVSTYDRSCGTPNYGAGSTLKYGDLEYPEGEPGSCPGTNATVPFQVFGEWLNQTSQPGAPTNVTIGADSWVSLNCNVGTNYRANGNFTVDAGVDGTSYVLPGFEQNGFNLGDFSTSTLTLAASKDVINNGALKQSGTPGSGVTSFVNIKDTNGAGLYYGIDITNGSALGATVVKVNGNFGSSYDYCPRWGSGSGFPTVKRCYYIDPTNAGSPQVTFYYEYNELNDLSPAELYVWKDNGDNTWTQITPAGRSACTAGSINCSVTVSSLGLTADAIRYVLSPAAPTAVTLTGLAATVQGGAIEIAWDTVSEVDNLGFNLYRDTSEAGPGVRLNAGLIPALGPGSPLGFHYSYLDAADLVPGATYTYWVEDVSTTGVATRHAPVSVFFAGEPTAVGLAAFGGTGQDGGWAGLYGSVLLVGLAMLAAAAALGRKRRDEE